MFYSSASAYCQYVWKCICGPKLFHPLHDCIKSMTPITHTNLTSVAETIQVHFDSLFLDCYPMMYLFKKKSVINAKWKLKAHLAIIRLLGISLISMWTAVSVRRKNHELTVGSISLIGHSLSRWETGWQRSDYLRLTTIKRLTVSVNVPAVMQYRNIKNWIYNLLPYGVCRVACHV